ncbi:TPA: hypothetical protein ACJJ31_002064, partial [Neisseria meningitidis]
VLFFSDRFLWFFGYWIPAFAGMTGCKFLLPRGWIPVFTGMTKFQTASEFLCFGGLQPAASHRFCRFYRSRRILQTDAVIPAKAGIQTPRHGNLSSKTVSQILRSRFPRSRE